MPAFQYLNPYTDFRVDDGSGSDLGFGSGISDEDLRGVIGRVNSIDVTGIERELADVTTQLQDRCWKTWQKYELSF